MLYGGKIMIIKDIIRSDFKALNVKDSIDIALDLMDNLKVNGMPVLDDDKNLVGMVVKADIYRFMIQPGHYDTYPVELIMSKSVIIANSDEDVITIANRLRKNDIVAMPVVENNKLLGLITIEDILDYFIKEN